MGRKYLVAKKSRLDEQAKRTAILYLYSVQKKLSKRGSLPSKYDIEDIQRAIDFLDEQ